MTVSSIIPVNNYEGNSSNKKFDFDFLIEKSSELVVEFISEDGKIYVLNEGIDYSINEIGNKNGSYITFPIEGSQYGVLKKNEHISLKLELVIKQETEFKNSTYFNFTTLEWVFDYIIRILQIISRKLERCFKVKETSDISPEKLLEDMLLSGDKTMKASQYAEDVLNSIKEKMNVFEGKIKDFNQTFQNCMKEILNTGDISHKSDVDLSNLSSIGENHFDNKYVKKAGDTMTGQLTVKNSYIEIESNATHHFSIKNTNFDRSSQDVSSDKFIGGLLIYDKNNKYASQYVHYHSIYDNTVTKILSYRDIGGKEITSEIRIGINGDGEAYFYFPKCSKIPTTKSSASNDKSDVVIKNYLSGRTGAIKFSSGLIVQWGTALLDATKQCDITFPFPFNDAKTYTMLFSDTLTSAETTEYNLDVLFCFMSSQSTNIKAKVLTNSMDAGIFSWFAIGY